MNTKNTTNRKSTESIANTTTKADDAQEEEFDLLALLLQQHDQEGRDVTHPSLPVDTHLPESEMVSTPSMSSPASSPPANELVGEAPFQKEREPTAEPPPLASPAYEEAADEKVEETEEGEQFDLLSLLLRQYDEGQDDTRFSLSENALPTSNRRDLALEDSSSILSPVERGEIDPRTEMEQLQALLLKRERQHIRELEREMTQLRLRLNDHDALVEILSPIIGHAIADRVKESQEEVAEALYPVIGKTISRAVTEAIRDLARSIDNTMRQNLHPKAFKRLMWRFRGLNPDEASLREMLPFQVKEIFLIHRDSGLLIHHLSSSAALTDADLISGMLTAIRSYVAESFGEGKEGSLDDISYGDLRILIQEGSLAILAIVLQGIEPSGFQRRMREQLSFIHNEFRTALRTFEGDALDEKRLNLLVRPLMETNDAAT